MPDIKSRIYYIDSMRAVLMMLGVVLHSAQVFNPAKTWLIHSEFSAFSAQSIIAMIHTFRMPVFFIISGFFCFMTIRKYGEDVFLKIRRERILVPLIVTAVTLNSLQAYILHESGWRLFDINTYLPDGKWISHLWFLNYVLVYFVLVYLVAKALKIPALKKFSLTSMASAKALIDVIPLAGVFLLLPTYQIMMLCAGKLLPSMYTQMYGLFSVYNLAYYAQFFLFGVVLSLNEDLFRKFTHASPYKVFLSIAVLVLIQALIGDDHALPQEVIREYTNVMMVWLICSFLFCLFRITTSKPSRIATFFADASYSIYLFHHLLVVIFGLWFIRMGIAGDFGLVALSLLVFLTCTAIHVLIISRSAWLRYLFNGQKNKPAPRPTALMANSRIMHSAL